MSSPRTAARCGLGFAVLMSVALQAQRPTSIDVPTFGSAVVHARPAALLMSGQEGGDLPMSLLALPDGACGGDSDAVTAWVEIDGKRLLNLVGKNGGELWLAAYVLDAAGAVTDRETRRLWIDPAQHLDALRDHDLTVALRLRAVPGDGSEIRVLAQWPEGPFGVRIRPLGSTTGEPVGWPPLVGRSTGDRAVNRDPAPGRPEVPAVGGWLESWVPATRPTLDGPTDLYLPVPTAKAGGPWGLRFTPRHGGSPIDLDAEDPGEGTRVPIFRGCVLVPVRVDPSTLPGGVYRWTATTGADEPDGTGWAEVTVGEVEPDELAVGRPVLGREEAVPPPEETPEARSERALRRAYRQALLRAAQADSESPGDELATFEESAFAALGSLARLEQIELRALGPLRGDGSPTALATALLHAESARVHLAARRGALVNHSLRLILQLLDRRETDREESGEALGSIGAWALRHGYVHAAHRLLAAAVELAPNRGDSQLLLAAIEEKAGRHTAAAQRLGELTQLDGFDRRSEARLRYAVNLARIGRHDEAAPWFEQVAMGSGPRWVRLLAIQEQIRLHRRPDPALAEATAREALGEWPGEPELILLLSELLESTGRFEAAREELEPIMEAAFDQPSPRTRYEKWPDVGSQNLGPATLEAAAEQRSRLIERLGGRSGR